MWHPQTTAGPDLKSNTHVTTETGVILANGTDPTTGRRVNGVGTYESVGVSNAPTQTSSPAPSSNRVDADRMEALQDRFDIPTVVVTRGSRGAVLLKEGVFYTHPGFRVEVADTVGSGDAFLAGLLFKIAEGTDPPAAITFASAMGALIASQHGPTPPYRIEDVLRIMKL